MRLTLITLIAPLVFVNYRVTLRAMFTWLFITRAFVKTVTQTVVINQVGFSLHVSTATDYTDHNSSTILWLKEPLRYRRRKQHRFSMPQCHLRRAYIRANKVNVRLIPRG